MKKQNLQEEAYYALVNIIENAVTPVIYSMSQFDSDIENKVIESKDIIFGDMKDNPNIFMNPNFEMPKELELNFKISNIFNNMIDCINNKTVRTIYRRVRNVYTNYSYYDDTTLNNIIEMLEECWNGRAFTTVMIISMLNMMENDIELINYNDIEECKFIKLIEQTINDELEKIKRIADNM